MTVGRDKRNILLVLFFLLAFGLVMLNSASEAVAELRYGDSSFFLRSQAFRIALGLILMMGVSRVDYHRYHRFAKPFLLVSIILLMILVLPFTTSIAPVTKRVRRWMIFPLTFQPSELVKIALVIWCASTILKKGSKIKDFKEGIMPISCISAVVMLLIAMEPDLSTAILCFSIVLVLLLLGRAKLQHILLLSLIFCGGFLVVAYVKGYQFDRITAILNSGTGRLDENYHYYQSMIALGSGGWFGRGIGNGLQKYFFLPEPHTDSIYSVIGEELGFVWTTGTLFLFLLIGFYGYRIMTRCNDLFGYLLVGGVLSLIFVPMLYSVTISVGMLPAAGVGLPFISFGGSSVVTLLASFGIIMNVAEHNTPALNRRRRRT